MLARGALLQLTSLACVLALPTIPTLVEDVNEAVIVREKRDPSRSYTFSGFMPGSGMSAIASSADFAPYHPRGWSTRREHPREPAAAEQPPPPPPEHGGQERPWGHEGEPDEQEEEDPVTRPPKKNKKKYKPHQEQEEEDEEKPARGSGGNAAASFNAWFPIMLGMFPGQGGEGYRGAGAGGYSTRDQPPASRSTVIANSVSHGRSGVASSHAVLYAGGGGQGQGHPQGR